MWSSSALLQCVTVVLSLPGGHQHKSGRSYEVVRHRIYDHQFTPTMNLVPTVTMSKPQNSTASHAFQWTSVLVGILAALNTDAAHPMLMSSSDAQKSFRVFENCRDESNGVNETKPTARTSFSKRGRARHNSKDTTVAQHQKHKALFKPQNIINYHLDSFNEATGRRKHPNVVPGFSNETEAAPNALDSSPNQKEFYNRQLDGRHLELLKRLRAEDYRLPGDLLPLQYLLQLQVYHWSNATTVGQVQLRFKALEDTVVILLHSYKLHIDREAISLNCAAASNISCDPPPSVVELVFLPEAEMIALTVRPHLRQGEEYNLTLTFEGELAKDEYGIYRLHYVEDNKTRYAALTQFQTTFARRVFPCLDEPRYKATFVVRVARPANCTALANTPRTSTTNFPGEPDWKWDLFEETPLMSTYILALAIVDYDHLTITGPRVTFSVWTRPSMLPYASFSLEMVPRLLYYYEHYLDVRYPLRKLDVLALPSAYSRAMENLGLIAMHEQVVLRSPSLSREDRILTCTIAAHELVHMWFGNLVTPSWWDQSWTSEGFATYLASKGTAAVLREFYTEEMFISHEFAVALSMDLPPFTRALAAEVMHNETLLVFDDLTYKKGASLVRMMSNFMTEEVFKKAMKKYLEEMKFGTSSNSDLLQIFDVVCQTECVLPPGVSLIDAMQPWLSNLGYPVLTVLRNQNGSVHVYQRVFSYRPGSLPSINETLYWIPFTMTNEQVLSFNDTTPLFWLPPTAASFILSPTPPPNVWMVANLQRAGYYRVNYDEDNWLRLARQLYTDHLVLPTAHRMQILDDAFHLYVAGLLQASVFSLLHAYVSREKHAPVWQVLYGNANMPFMERIHPDHFTECQSHLSQLLKV